MAPTKKRTASKSSKNPQYGAYLLKIFKSVHPDCSLSRDACFVIDGVIDDFQTRLIAKSLKAASDEGKSTLKGKHSRAATMALLSGELRTHAVTNGERSLNKYVQAT